MDLDLCRISPRFPCAFRRNRPLDASHRKDVGTRREHPPLCLRTERRVCRHTTFAPATACFFENLADGDRDQVVGIAEFDDLIGEKAQCSAGMTLRRVRTGEQSNPGFPFAREFLGRGRSPRFFDQDAVLCFALNSKR